MPLKLPKYVKAVRSKGKLYLYFDTGKRVNGKPIRVRLPSMDDREFWPSHSAHMGHRTRRESSGDAKQVVTIPFLTRLYEESKEYADKSEGTRRVYDIQLRRIERLLPTAPVDKIEKVDVRRLRDALGRTPGAANLFLAVFSNLMDLAVDNDFRTTNPCTGLKPLKTGEHKAWPEPVLIAALEAEDDRVRLLAHLLFYTAQRINDVLRITWSDVRDGKVRVFAQKQQRQLEFPIHKRLAAELARTPKRGIRVVSKEDGSPLSETIARDTLKAFAAAHGAIRVPHGIRKNAVITLLEMGNTIVETAAVSGQSLKVVEYYARQRDEGRLGSAAILRWEQNETGSFKQEKTG